MGSISGPPPPTQHVARPVPPRPPHTDLQRVAAPRRARRRRGGALARRAPLTARLELPRRARRPRQQRQRRRVATGGYRGVGDPMHPLDQPDDVGGAVPERPLASRRRGTPPQGVCLPLRCRCGLTPHAHRRRHARHLLLELRGLRQKGRGAALLTLLRAIRRQELRRAHDDGATRRRLCLRHQHGAQGRGARQQTT